MSGKAAKKVRKKKKKQYFPLRQICLSQLSGSTLFYHIERAMCDYLLFSIHLSKCNNYQSCTKTERETHYLLSTYCRKY